MEVLDHEHGARRVAARPVQRLQRESVALRAVEQLPLAQLAAAGQRRRDGRDLLQGQDAGLRRSARREGVAEREVLRVTHTAAAREHDLTLCRRRTHRTAVASPVGFVPTVDLKSMSNHV